MKGSIGRLYLRCLMLLFLIWIALICWKLRGATNQVRITSITYQPTNNNFIFLRLTFTNTVPGERYIVERSSRFSDAPVDFTPVIFFDATNAVHVLEFYQTNNVRARYFRAYLEQ